MEYVLRFGDIAGTRPGEEGREAEGQGKEADKDKEKKDGAA